MKRLDGFSFIDMVEKYINEKDLCGCIVMSSNARRRYVKDAFSPYIGFDVLNIRDNKVYFNSKSVIHLCIAADRHDGRMYNDILIDGEIKDDILLSALGRAEYLKEIFDLGEISPSQELNDFVSTFLKDKFEYKTSD